MMCLEELGDVAVVSTAAANFASAYLVLIALCCLGAVWRAWVTCGEGRRE